MSDATFGYQTGTAEGRRQDRHVLVVAATAAFMGTWSLVALSPLLPLIQNGLHVSVGSAGRLLAAPALVAVVFLAITFPLADSVRTHRRLSVAYIALILSSAAGAFAGSYSLLLGARLVTGLADAVLLPQAFALVGKIASEESRRRGIYLTSASAGLGAVLGLALIAGIAAAWSWRAALVGLAVCSALGLGSRRLLRGQPELATAASRPDDWRRAYASVYRVVLAPANLLLLGSAMTGAMVWYGFVAFAGDILTSWIGLSQTALALALPMVGLCYVATSAAVPVLVGKRLSDFSIALLSSLITGLLALTLLMSHRAVLFGVLVAAMLAAVRGPGMASLQVLMLQEKVGEGVAMSVMQFVMTCGLLIGTAIGGVLIDNLGYPAFFLMCAAASILSLLPLAASRQMAPVIGRDFAVDRAEAAGEGRF